jgi:hypothetical protein
MTDYHRDIVACILCAAHAKAHPKTKKNRVSICHCRKRVPPASWCQRAAVCQSGRAHPCPRVEKLGAGGCATNSTNYPQTLIPQAFGVPSVAACEVLCTNHTSCVGFQYCDHSNCNGACGIFGGSVEQYVKENGYPGVTCYLRPEHPWPLNPSQHVEGLAEK